ncbi:hypothetical protein V5799_018674 [Amblyomma americanum]|uniref:Uncharacterized protein n=1 Tax=Amblyomma americanum TaxID=6943 RepID=A0AAQ4EZM3_AMBAM
MEALRHMRHRAKGATPVTDSDSGYLFGNHVRSMLLACWGAMGAGTALGFASAALGFIEHEPWYNVTPNSPPQNRWIADSLLLGATVGALLSGQWGCPPSSLTKLRATQFHVAYSLSLSSGRSSSLVQYREHKAVELELPANIVSPHSCLAQISCEH